MFIFGTAIDHSRIMNPIDHGISMFIFMDPVGLWKFHEYIVTGPSRPRYRSTAYNIQRILFKFGTGNNFSRSMNPIDLGISMFSFLDSVGL